MNETQKDRAKGAFYGVLIGDAAGAHIEFINRDLTEEEIKKAMSMKYDSFIGKGQITDDGELTLMLADALKTYQFNTDKIAENYVYWYKTKPFDIGKTCLNAFSFDEKPNYINMISASKKHNTFSQANGALMRCIAIPIWYVTHYINFDPDLLAKYAKLECQMTHPNEVCCDINAIYCIMVAYLIKYPNDHNGCFKLILNWIDNHVESVAFKWFKVVYENDSLNEIFIFMNDEYPIKTNVGWVKWAFILAIFYLKNKYSYEKAIYETIKQQGDRDTNAAIVGGLLGAYHGFHKIPEYMSKPVMEYSYSEGNGIMRPMAFSVKKSGKIIFESLIKPH